MLTHRNDWQKIAYDRLKNDLSYAKDNPLLLFDNSQSEHLVIVYGNPQVGKTTLILTLIGISDESFNTVENVLRAGRLGGNSSTSTAIIYSKSEDDHYRCYTNTDLNEKNIKLNENEVECKLKSIREKVETRFLDHDTILYIKIPQFYFNDSNAENISIMDMPGVDSCNKSEWHHVKHLFEKYIPICSVCIIAARGNEIQGVSNIKLVNNIDWKKINDKFVLVLTHCYGDAKIKAYFKETKRDCTFYEYVRREYGDTLKSVLGSDNKTELFPVDLGKSLQQLCNEVENESDKNEILNTRKMMLAELCLSIKKRSGNRFISAINELERYVDSISSAKIQNLGISDKEETRHKIIDRINELSQISKNENAPSDDSESETYITVKMNIEQEINELYDAKFLLMSYISSYPQIDIEGTIYKNGLSKKITKISILGNIDIYLNDPKKLLINIIRKKTYKYVADLVNTAEAIQYSDNYLLNINIEKIDLLKKIETETISLFEDKLYPETRIGTIEHVYLPSVKQFFMDMVKTTNEITSAFICSITDVIDQKISEKINQLNQLKSELSCKCHLLTLLNDEISELNKEASKIKETADTDKNKIPYYAEYAFSAYAEQRKCILDQINSDIPAKEKITLVFLLGLLDRDYENTMGGTDENRYHTANSE